MFVYMELGPMFLNGPVCFNAIVYENSLSNDPVWVQCFRIHREFRIKWARPFAWNYGPVCLLEIEIHKSSLMKWDFLNCNTWEIIDSSMQLFI